MRPRLGLLIPVVILAILTFTTILGVATVKGRIRRAATELPVPLQYERLRLRVAPVALEFHGLALARSPVSGPVSPSPDPAGRPGPSVALHGARAERVVVVPDVADALRAVRAGSSAREIAGSLQSITATDVEFAVERQQAMGILRFSGESRTVRFVPPTEDSPVQITVSGLTGRVSREAVTAPGPATAPEVVPDSNAPTAAPDTSDVRAATADPHRTIAEAAEHALASLLTFRHRLPPIHAELTDGTFTVATGRVRTDALIRLAGTFRSVPGDPLRAELSFDDLPARLALGDAGAGTVNGNVHLEVTGATTATVAGRVQTDSLIVTDPRLAPEPIGPVSLTYDFEATLDTRAPFPAPTMARRVPGTDVPAPIGAGAAEDANLRGAIRLTRGDLQIGSVTGSFRPALVGLNAPAGDIPFPGPFTAPARLDGQFELPETPLQTIVDAVPPAIVGPLAGLQMDGTLTWTISWEAPIRQLSWTRWEGKHLLSAPRIVKVDPAYDVRNLAGAFVHQIINEETGYRRVIEVPAWGTSPDPTDAPGSPSGPAPDSSSRAAAASPVVTPLGSTPENAEPDPTYRYARYHQIAPAMTGAAVTAEDGEFFLHNGVNWLALTFAAEVNLSAGEIVIGGSTIPMQVAKNIFLDDQRVVVRKLQELGLVALANISEAVPRERVLEIYLNVIEFGPNLYGISDAARYYFNTTPANLTVPQSVWLATIIRNPRVLSQEASRGTVPPHRLRQMEAIMELMVERDRLTQAQLEEARGVQPGFVGR